MKSAEEVVDTESTMSIGMIPDQSREGLGHPLKGTITLVEDIEGWVGAVNDAAVDCAGRDFMPEVHFHLYSGTAGDLASTSAKSRVFGGECRSDSNPGSYSSRQCSLRRRELSNPPLNIRHSSKLQIELLFLTAQRC